MNFFHTTLVIISLKFTVSQNSFDLPQVKQRNLISAYPKSRTQDSIPMEPGTLKIGENHDKKQTSLVEQEL